MMQRLDELLQCCTVKITVPGQSGWGTGFFVAPGLILTCAHVVKALKPEVPVQLAWQQQEGCAEATVTQLVPECDLVLLQVSLPQNISSSCVYLGDEFQPNDDLYTFGYPDNFPQGTSVTGLCEGRAIENNSPLIVFKSAQVRPGLSGSPLLNLKTGRVCGIVKFTRDRSLDLGGGAIPTSVILQQFSELTEHQQQFHQQDRRWSELAKSLTANRQTAQLQGIPNNLPRTGAAEFVGRDAALKELHQCLQQHERVAITAIAGMGGVGKSELAIQYANYHLKQQTYPAGVCWLEAQELEVGTKLVQLATSWFNLVPPDNLDLPGQVEFCWRRWAAGDALIIFDGLNTAADYERIVPYLPPNDDRFKVLITTRERVGAPVVRLDLDVLKPRAALKLLEPLVGRERLQREPWIARQLCRRLGYLPLGLELVGRYLVQEEDLTLTEMTAQLEAEGLTQEALTERAPRMTAKRGAEAAFELSWRALPPAAQQLSYLLSLFAPVTIPWSLVERCLEEQQQRTFKKARRTLLNLSLLERQSEGAYRLHPLIRNFFSMKRQAQEQLDSSQIDTLKQQFCQGMVAVAKEIPETPTREQISAVTDAIPHLAEAATTWKDKLTDNSLIAPYIGLGQFYQGQGLYAQAQPWFSQCLNHSRDRFGGEHPSVATSLSYLAALYRNQGRYSEAEPLNLKALALRQRLLGEEHPDVAQSLNNLALLYRNQGRYSEAETLYLKALALRQRLLGEEHPDVATSLNNLAYLYDNQRRYSEAEPLNLKALSLRQRLLGEEHPNVATSLSYLAALYRNQGRYSEAEPLYLKALELHQRLLGEEHPNVATSLLSLAALYRNQGRYSEAEPLYLKALELYQRLLGEEHPYVATSLNNLADLYRNQGRYSEAEPLYFKALELYQRLLGGEHPYTLIVQKNLDDLQRLIREQPRSP